MNEVFAYLLPGMMYFWVMFIGQGPLQEILQEKETHVLPRILAAPVTLSQFLIAKMARCFFLCGIVMLLLILLSAVLFNLRWGNLFLLLLMIGACAWSMTGLLAVVYSLAKTREQANTLSSIILLICAMVGGSMFPFEDLPGFLQTIGQFTPNRWGVLVLQGVLRAKPLAQLWAPLACLMVIGLTGSLVAFFLFRRHLIYGHGR